MHQTGLVQVTVVSAVSVNPINVLRRFTALTPPLLPVLASLVDSFLASVLAVIGSTRKTSTLFEARWVQTMLQTDWGQFGQSWLMSRCFRALLSRFSILDSSAFSVWAIVIALVVPTIWLVSDLLDLCEMVCKDFCRRPSSPFRVHTEWSWIGGSHRR